MREFEKEGKIGKLHDYFYTTVGNGTAVASAKAFAAEYAQKLLSGRRGCRYHDRYVRYLHALRCNDGKRDRAGRHPRGAYVHGNPHFHDGGRQPDCPHHCHSSSPGQSRPDAGRGDRPCVGSWWTRALEALTTEVEDQTIFEV